MVWCIEGVGDRPAEITEAKTILNVNPILYFHCRQRFPLITGYVSGFFTPPENLGNIMKHLCCHRRCLWLRLIDRPDHPEPARLVERGVMQPRLHRIEQSVDNKGPGRQLIMVADRSNGGTDHIPSLTRDLLPDPGHSLSQNIAEALTVSHRVKQFFQKFPGSNLGHRQAGLLLSKATRFMTIIEPID